MGLALADRGRQRGLAVIDVANGAHVYMKFISLKFLFGHFYYPKFIITGQARLSYYSLTLNNDQ
jgi:hypothetical protein